MTKNRKSRRAAKAASKAMLRVIRPDARFISWPQLERCDPDAAMDIRRTVSSVGYRLDEVLIYEHGGNIAVMYPPEFT